MYNCLKKGFKKEQDAYSYKLRADATNTLQEYVSKGHPKLKHWYEVVKSNFKIHDLSKNTIVKEYVGRQSNFCYEQNGRSRDALMMQFISIHLQRPLHLYNVHIFKEKGNFFAY